MSPLDEESVLGVSHVEAMDVHDVRLRVLLSSLL